MMIDEDGDGKIALLPKEVVDKIAAGEVVVRPVNAIKELIENSLDAGSTEILVEIVRGGLELIRILDNGSGIAHRDMPLVCSRFATSKMHKVDDLRSICTYGFRGEALASISMVAACVTITSRTATDQQCAHRASYQNGRMESECASLAGLPGTNIVIDRLFHNAPARKAALRYPNEEANRVSDLLVKYAIHYPAVSFAFRRLDGNGGGDFRSVGSGDQHATIRTLLHAKMTKDLLNIAIHDPALHFTAKACIASPSTLFTSTAIQARQDRQKIFHLFINGRCVECPRLKQAIDAVFAAKDAHCPFLTLSLEIEPNRVDVNVHPTKSIVYFLEQDRIIERIEKEMHQLASEYHRRGTIELSGGHSQTKKNEDNSNRKRNRTVFSDTGSGQIQYSINSTNPNKLTINQSVEMSKRRDSDRRTTPTPPSKTKVRVDASNRTMDEFTERIHRVEGNSSSPLCTDSPVNVRRQATSASSSALSIVSELHLVPILNFEEQTEGEREEEGNGKKQRRNPNDDAISQQTSSVCSTPRHFEFQSLVNLRREICRNANSTLCALFREHYLIGFYDCQHALLQSGSDVFLIQCESILREFFYQLVIFSFGNMGAYKLEQSHEETYCIGDRKAPLPIRDLLKLYLENEVENDEPKEEIDERIESACKVLLERKTILWNFFSLKIIPDDRENESAPMLGTLPCILEGYLPQMASIPDLLYQLAQISYSDEQSCYSKIANVLSEFFTPYSAENNQIDWDETEQRQIQTVLRAIVFPALKNRFLPSTALWQAVDRVTSIEQSFKHFGRC